MMSSHDMVVMLPCDGLGHLSISVSIFVSQGWNSTPLGGSLKAGFHLILSRPVHPVTYIRLILNPGV